MNIIRRLVTVRCPKGHEYESLREDWQTPKPEPCGSCLAEWIRANMPAATPTGVWRDFTTWESV